MVPLLPTKRDLAVGVRRDRPPWMITSPGPPAVRRMPRPSKQSCMRWVSSLTRVFWTQLSPSARAAKSRARLVMLFEPGTIHVAVRPGAMGVTGRGGVGMARGG